MIDLDSVQVAANRNRIPDSIWMILCVVTVFSMAAVGYQFGLSEARSWAVTILLVIVFITVIMLIADLHRPQAGLLKISQQPLQLQIERAKGWGENDCGGEPAYVMLFEDL